MIDIEKDVFSKTDIGLVRKANEDSCGFAETPNGHLFVVCDGMGGHVGGATASKIAVESIIDYFVRDTHSDIRAALSTALNFANMQIIATAQANPQLKGMGTTACIVLINTKQVWFAHVGDSRIYLLCNRQKWLHRITKDHSFVQGLVDQGLISDAEAEHHPNKNRILKALGIKEDLQPEICQSPVLPAKNDLLLICSDGLSGMLSDNDIQHVLLQNSSLEDKGNLLIALAKQVGGNDNITVQLIRISQSVYDHSVFESKNPVERVYTPKPSTNFNSPRQNNMPINTGKNNNIMRYVLIIGVVLAVAIASVFMWNKYGTTHRVEQVDDNKHSSEVTQGSDSSTKSVVVETKEWESKVENSNYRMEIDISNMKFSFPNDNIKKIFNKDGNYTPSKKFKGTVVRKDDSCDFEKDIIITQDSDTSEYGIIIQ